MSARGCGSWGRSRMATIVALPIEDSRNHHWTRPHPEMRARRTHQGVWRRHFGGSGARR